MFALSYFMSLFKASPRKTASSVNKEEAPTNGTSKETHDTSKLWKKTCEEKCEEVLHVAGEDSEECYYQYLADSEESGVEYESATDQEHDCDTLVIGDESDDDGQDILDAQLLQLIMQADEKDKKHGAGDEETNKETILCEVNTSRIKCDAMSVISKNKSEDTSEKDDSDQKHINTPNGLSSSDFGTDASKLPTLSEAVLSMFIVDDNNPPQNDYIKNGETENLTIIPDSMSISNKPTAIVKPCQNSDVEDKITEHEIIKEKDSLESWNRNLKNNDSKHKTYLKQENESHESNSNDEIATQIEFEQDEYNKLCSKIKNTLDCQLDEAQHTLTESKNELKTEEDIIEIAFRLKGIEKEINKFIEEINHVEENNRQMMIIVDEFEKTISQLVVEKEREEVCQQIVLERIASERDDVVRDHQNVERAFADLNHKYERTKEVVAGLQLSEDNLKSSVNILSGRYTAGEQKYQDSKTEAEAQLTGAGETLAVMQRSKDREIVRLAAMIRKAEMNVSSLEEEIDQKTQENQELTAMCDDLLAKLETAN